MNNIPEHLDDSYVEKLNKMISPMEMVKYYAIKSEQEPKPRLYAGLIDEEYIEWREEACTSSAFYATLKEGKCAELKELADLVYVIYGYANAKGWQLDEAIYRVHVSNLGRMYQDDGKIHRREDGKILKNPNAPKPDLSDLV